MEAVLLEPQGGDPPVGRAGSAAILEEQVGLGQVEVSRARRRLSHHLLLVVDGEVGLPTRKVNDRPGIEQRRVRPSLVDRGLDQLQRLGRLSCQAEYECEGSPCCSF